MKKCPFCAEDIQEFAVKCKHCGEWLDHGLNPNPVQVTDRHLIVQSNKSRGTAALLAILLGGLGVHKFYLNQAGWGIIYLLFCWTFIPAVIGFIEGIIYATMSNEEFDRRYNKLYTLQPNINQKSESVISRTSPNEIIYSAVVGWSSAKLRSDPIPTSSIIERLPQGTKVEVINQVEEWVQVNVPQMGLQGWMFKNSLE